MRMETPFFVIHKALLDQNIKQFKEAMIRNWPYAKLSYSVKTNSLPWILKYMNECRIMAEVVSEEEYELAKNCGFDNNNIIYNGPIKTKQSFLHAIHNGAYVNIDSSREIEWLCEAKTVSNRIGIRINIPPELFDEADTDYLQDGFRFGFSDKNDGIGTVLKCLGRAGISSIGLHLHCNSVTRSPRVYVAISRYAVALIEKYNIDVSFIDIGGGFFGGVPGKTAPDEYFQLIAGELYKSKRARKAILMAEPGSALVGSTVDYVTSVIDVKDTEKSRIVTTDGSRIHIDPLWKKKEYMYQIKTRSPDIIDRQVVCGYTCMDHDRIMTIQQKPALEVGDRIIYHRVGAYSMTFGGLFIRYLPEVFVEDKGIHYLARHRSNVQEYYDIET